MDQFYIVGDNRKQALVSIVERKTGLAFIKKVHQKTADVVRDVIIELLKPIKPRVKTITSDNGLEFAEHRKIAESLDYQYYLAHPYSSWERGSNENLNGLIIVQENGFNIKHLMKPFLNWIRT